MSETGAVKSFFGRMDDGVVDVSVDACAVDLGFFIAFAPVPIRP